MKSFRRSLSVVLMNGEKLGAIRKFLCVTFASTLLLCNFCFFDSSERQFVLLLVTPDEKMFRRGKFFLTEKSSELFFPSARLPFSSFRRETRARAPSVNY